MYQMEKKVIISILVMAAILGTGFYFIYESEIIESMQNTDETKKQNDSDDVSLIDVESQNEVLTIDHEKTQIIVTTIIEKYDEIDGDLIEILNYLEYNLDGKFYRYGFVLDEMTTKLLAHPNSDLLGQNIFDVIEPVESKEQILSELQTNGKVWVHYEFENPETGNIEPKTSLFELHDSLIFASGFYN